MWSFAAKTAVTSGSAASSFRARSPTAGSSRRSERAGGSIPAARRCFSQPATRCCASNQFSGPAMCQTVPWPSSSRCSVAATAPAPDRPRQAGFRSFGPRLDGDDGKVIRELEHGVRGLGLRGDHEDALDALHAQPLDGLEDRGPVERLAC